MPAYTFDVSLIAAVTVRAESETHARAMIARVFDCADCNGGVWPNGAPVLFEASIDGAPDLADDLQDDPFEKVQA